MRALPFIILILFFQKGNLDAQESQIEVGMKGIVNTTEWTDMGNIDKNVQLTHNIGGTVQFTRISNKNYRFSLKCSYNTYSIGCQMYSDTLNRSVKFVKKGALIDVGVGFGKNFKITEKTNLLIDIGLTGGHYLFLKENSKMNFDTISLQNNPEKISLVVATPHDDFHPYLLSIQNVLGFQYQINDSYFYSISIHSSIVLNSMSHTLIQSAFIFDSKGNRESNEDQILYYKGDSTFLALKIGYKF